MLSSTSRSARRAPWHLASLALLVLTLVAFVPPLVTLGRWSADALHFPFGIDYGEGIVWEQLVGLTKGQAYGTVQGVPAIVYHYPPFYHLLTAVLSQASGADTLWLGRLVSLISSLGTAVLIVLTVRRLVTPDADRAAAWLCSILAGVLFLQLNPVAYWAPLMRVDPLALFLSMAGLLCSMTALKRPKLIYAAAVLFVLAVYTKQTSVAAPAAVFGTLLFVRRPLAIRGITVSMALGLLLLALLMLLSEGRFLTHIVQYNVNRFSWQTMRTNLGAAKGQIGLPFFVFGGVAGLALLYGATRRSRWLVEPDRTASLVMLLTLVAFKSVMLILMAKHGASTNYLLDWLALMCIVCGLGLYQCFALIASSTGTTAPHLRVVGIGGGLLLLSVPFLLSASPLQLDFAQEMSTERRIVGIVKSCDKWVIGDDMTAIMRSGKRVVWEPAIFAELAASGLYDERAVVESIEAGRVCAVIVENNQMVIEARYTLPVRRAIEQHFARRQQVGKWLVYY